VQAGAELQAQAKFAGELPGDLLDHAGNCAAEIVIMVIPGPADDAVAAAYRGGKAVKHTAEVASTSIKVSRSIVKADPKTVVNAMAKWRSIKFRVNGQNILLDKKGMKHILEEHHPLFWNGGGQDKLKRSFFSQKACVEDIESMISEVLRQNHDKIAKIGPNIIDNITGTIDGVRYQLGLNRGRIGQFFPVLD
jgi:hypothetical protein